MKKVITYGTFDLFHKGHYNIIKRAKALGDYLIVGVTSESYDIERGKLNVRDSLLTRIENVRRTGLADKIIIEEYQGQKINDIIKYDIDTLVVGSDWEGKFDHLRRYCNVVYLPRTRDISSTQLREKGEIFSVGIVTDSMEDGRLVSESILVSGLNVECVYSEDQALAMEFRDCYSLNSWETDYDEFLDKVDIVYVRTALPSRTGYVRRAIEAGKFVISDTPICTERKELHELFELAREKKVVLIEKIMLVYLRAFNQLVWMTNGSLVGDVISVRCAISEPFFYGGRPFDEMISHALCAIVKILGKDVKEVIANPVRNPEGENIYNMITLRYEHQLATIEIGSSRELESGFTILGTQGRIHIPNDWWNTGYFEAKVQGNDFLKRFSFNFEGNGFRYLLQELLIIMNDHRTECTRLFYGESEKMIEILKEIDL